MWYTLSMIQVFQKRFDLFWSILVFSFRLICSCSDRCIQMHENSSLKFFYQINDSTMMNKGCPYHGRILYRTPLASMTIFFSVENESSQGKCIHIVEFCTHGRSL